MPRVLKAAEGSYSRARRRRPAASFGHHLRNSRPDFLQQSAQGVQLPGQLNRRGHGTGQEGRNRTCDVD